MSKKKQQPRPASDTSKGRPRAVSAAAASRREQLRAQQATEAKRARTRRIVTVAAGVLALVIIATVIVVLVQQRARQQGAATPNPSAAQIVPPNASADGVAVDYVAATEPKADAPQVRAYLDYQCPGCGQASVLIDPKLEALADRGEIELSYQMLHGLDNPYPGDHSLRAAIATTCSDQFGVFPEYSKIIFANQPAREGDGWTDEQLLEWAGQAGISGADLDSFSQCYADRATSDFVLGMQQAKPEIVKATPSFTVNGTLVTFSSADIASEDALLAAIERAA